MLASTVDVAECEARVTKRKITIPKKNNAIASNSMVNLVRFQNGRCRSDSDDDKWTAFSLYAVGVGLDGRDDDELEEAVLLL